MDAGAENHKLGKGVHVVGKNGVVEDDARVTIKARNGDNNVDNRIDDVGDKSW